MNEKKYERELKVAKSKYKDIGFRILEQVFWIAACLLFLSYDWRLAVGIMLFDFQLNLQILRAKWDDVHFIKRILIEDQKTSKDTPD